MSLTKNEIEELLPDALEHMYDYSYLGTHSLAHLRCVKKMVIQDRTPHTHVDHGRAVSKTLQLAIDELRPADVPSNVGHETRFYSILHQEYCEGKENREVAMDLLISERTFYRDRRRAIHVLAQIVWEMENGE